MILINEPIKQQNNAVVAIPDEPLEDIVSLSRFASTGREKMCKGAVSYQQGATSFRKIIIKINLCVCVHRHECF